MLRRLQSRYTFLKDFNLYNFIVGEKPAKGWIGSLDGLRAIAVILVFFAHGSRLIDVPENLTIFGFFFKPAMHYFGRCGVYLFFILSSFLLTGQLLREKVDLKSIHTWTNYTFKRLIRIYPLYIFILFVYLIFPGFRYNFSNFVNHLLLQEGFGHFWTIRVEFQYYLVLPIVLFLMVFILNRNLMLSSIVFTVFLVLIEGFNIIYPEDAQGNEIVLPHLPIFLMGSLAALVNMKVSPLLKDARPRTRVIMELVSGSLLLAIVFSIPNVVSRNLWSLFSSNDFASLPASHWIFTLQAFLWCVFLVTHLQGTGFLKKALSHPSLRLISTLSFGLYLWHIAVLGYIEAYLPVPGVIKFIAVFIITLAISATTFVLIERPFSKLKFKTVKK
ncbi:MAG: acyltransferase [Cyanobacteria bacterium J06592_8]